MSKAAARRLTDAMWLAIAVLYSHRALAVDEMGVMVNTLRALARRGLATVVATDELRRWRLTRRGRALFDRTYSL